MSFPTDHYSATENPSETQRELINTENLLTPREAFESESDEDFESDDDYEPEHLHQNSLPYPKNSKEEVISEVTSKEESSSIKKESKQSDHVEVFPCLVCKFTANNERSLKLHSTKHKRQAGINCLDCEEVFKSKREMSDHSVELHGGLKCTDCDRRFQSRVSFNAHHSVEHMGKTWSCEVCGKEFKSNQHMKTHMNTHLGVKPHVCDQCGAAFTDLSALIRHTKKQHASGIIRESTTCLICGKILPRLENVLFKFYTHFTGVMLSL